MRVTGPTLEQLDRRGDEFAALIRREIKATLDEVAPRVDSVDDLVTVRTQWAVRIDQRLADHVMGVWWKSADDTHAQLALAGKRVERSLTAAISIPRVLKSIADLFRVGVKNRLRDIGDLIWNTTREQLIEGNLAGESIDQIRERIVATTDIVAPRAEVIARNEVIAASEAGSYEQMQATTLDATKEWLATHDGHTRPTHRDVNGEIVDMRGKFIVGGYPMDRPHDPTAPIELTINCRCTLLWDIPDDEFITYDDDALAAAGDWVPGQHPRDSRGKFIKGLGPNHGKKLKITHALVHKKHEPNTVIAATGDGTKQVTWDGKEYILARRQDNGDWRIEKSVIKSKAYVAINAYGDDWREPDAADTPKEVAPPPKPPKPPKTTPIPEATVAVSIEPKVYTNLQRAKVQAIFQKNGVKWHNDSKAMYNAALEVSKTHSDLTMGDALVIMDQSLTKKTGDPFQTKITKFLKTNSGKQHALQVGGSAAVGTTEQGTPGAPTLNPSISGAPPLPKNLTNADARELQRRMNNAYPPPWNGVQTNALKNYTGSAYTEINKCLRNPGFTHCSESVHKRIANIKAAMKPSTDDIVVYRKTHPPTFGFTSPAQLESLVGKTIEDKGVVSTSITKGVWHGSVHLEIEAPKGSRMAYVQPISHHPEEDEIVLAPGTKFEVISVVPHHSFPNDRFVKLRVVPGSGTS